MNKIKNLQNIEGGRVRYVIDDPSCPYICQIKGLGCCESPF